MYQFLIDTVRVILLSMYSSHNHKPMIEKIKKSAAVSFDEDDYVKKMVEKPFVPESNWCVPPFYIYEKDDVAKVRIALENGCNKDAPGSFISWLYDKANVYAMEMPGKRYDIGNLESYKRVCEEYKGIEK